MAAFREQRRTAAAAVPIALLGLVAAACGSSSAAPTTTTSVARARVLAAVARTEAAGTAHMTVVAQSHQTDGTGVLQSDVSANITTTGDVRFVGPEVALVITTASTVPSPGGAPTSSPSTETAHFVQIGRRSYEGAGAPPVSWIRRSATAPYPLLQVLGVGALRSPSGAVTSRGSAMIDGERTSVYRIDVPDGTETQHDSGSAGQVRHMSSAPYTLTVWLDPDGRIVRASSSVVTILSPTSESGGTTTVRQTQTATLDAFGAPVHIAAPRVTVRG